MKHVIVDMYLKYKTKIVHDKKKLKDINFNVGNRLYYVCAY